MNEIEEKTKQPESPSSKQLSQLVREHMIAAFAAGLVPFPIVDIAIMSAVQLNLVRKLAGVYGVPFFANAGKGILGALAGGTLSAYAGPVIAGIVKGIPVAGTTLGIISMPILSAASTYAVGRLFIAHFESGGTLLTFDTNKATGAFRRFIRIGKTKATKLRADGEL
jgi:uncharacterized protein (DUF697 family)